MTRDEIIYQLRCMGVAEPESLADQIIATVDAIYAAGIRFPIDEWTLLNMLRDPMKGQQPLLGGSYALAQQREALFREHLNERLGTDL